MEASALASVKFKLRVSKSFLKNYNSTVAIEIASDPVSHFFDECTRDQAIICNLNMENQHLIDKIALEKSGIMHSNFLNELIHQSILRHAGKKLASAIILGKLCSTSSC